MKSLKAIVSSPITHFNVLVCGFLIAIQMVHTHAHYKMDIDVESYVAAFCKKNKTTCQRMVNRD